MPGKLPTTSRCPVSMFKQQHFRVGRAKRHIGHVLRRRRKPWRHDEIIASGHIAQIGAVLIHDREALAAVLGRARLVDKSNPRIEKALLAGNPRKDRIRDNMGNPARVVGIRHILAPGDLRARRHVPQPELGLQPPVGGAAGAAGHYELRVDHAPGVHLWSLVRIADRFDKCLGIDGRKKHGTFEIIGNDAGQLSARPPHRRQMPSPRSVWV